MSRSEFPNHAETKHWLEFIKRDEWWKSQMPVSIEALAGALSTSWQNITASLANKGTHTDFTILSRIGKLIPDIESRKLCFPKMGSGIVKQEKRHVPHFLWLEPEPRKIPRLGTAWTLWAECQACANNKFLPVVMNDKPHVACYHCLPPGQYRSIGAEPQKKSLIHLALRTHY